MATSDAPVSIGQVALTVKDIDQMAAFYEDIIGLKLISRDGKMALLGTETHPLIELRADKNARRQPNEAGLFHTAFLLPSQQDLGLWLRHVSDRDTRLEGASDHGVSEALYLTDPEGNGVEVYRDRPREQWVRNGDQVEMGTAPLDLKALAAAQGVWAGAPAGTVIGHVHLQVGNIDTAETFLLNALGLTRTFHVPSASWYGAGGYHHHLAVNTWHSLGAGPRSKGTTGLAEIELLAAPGTLPAGRLSDPWGTEFKITTT